MSPHPTDLQDKWVVYTLHPRTWQAEPKYEFSTAEGFWELWNNLPSLSDIDTTFYIGKRDITPAWENKENAMGGRISISRALSETLREADETFFTVMRDVVLAIIGNTMACYDAVNVIELQVSRGKKKCMRLRLWVPVVPRATLEEMMAAEHEVITRRVRVQKIEYDPFFPLYTTPMPPDRAEAYMKRYAEKGAGYRGKPDTNEKLEVADHNDRDAIKAEVEKWYTFEGRSNWPRPNYDDVMVDQFEPTLNQN